MKRGEKLATRDDGVSMHFYGYRELGDLGDVVMVTLKRGGEQSEPIAAGSVFSHSPAQYWEILKAGKEVL